MRHLSLQPLAFVERPKRQHQNDVAICHTINETLANPDRSMHDLMLMAEYTSLCLSFRFVRKLSEGDAAEVEAEAERRSALGELHADEFNPYGQAYLQAEDE